MGEAHRASRTRAGYFGAVVAVSAAAVLVLVAMGLRSLFTAATGTAAPLTDTRLIEEVAGPLLLAVPYLVAWWWHLRRLTAEALAFGGPVHAQAARRAGRLVVSFVGLAGFSVGVAWELQSLLDAIASAGQDTLFSSAEAGEVTASALATALVGLALWAPAWILSQRERAREVVVVATSAARRAYLFLVSGVAVVALMGALAFVIYQATRMVLGTELIDDASWALAVLIVAAVALAYHLYCLRADLLVARTVAPPEPHAEDAGRAVETIEISAPEGADFKVLNAAIRTELPEGYELRVVSHQP
jgi:hypothetical protein